MIQQHEKIIASGQGNLAGGKLRFGINLAQTYALNDENLNKGLDIQYQLHRDDFNLNGSRPLRIFYSISYAVTSSSMSLHYSKSEKIQIDRLFKDLLVLQEPERKFNLPSRTLSLRELSPLDRLIRSASSRESTQLSLPEPKAKNLQISSKEDLKNQLQKIEEKLTNVPRSNSANHSARLPPVIYL